MPQSERRRILNDCFFKLTNKLKKVLTYGFTDYYHKDFWCDGHPNICRACIGFRCFLTHNHMPMALEIITNRGTYIWRAEKARNHKEYYEWLQGILTRRIKERYDKIRKKQSNEGVNEVVTCER